MITPMIQRGYCTNCVLHSLVFDINETDCRHCWSGHEKLFRVSILERVYVDAPVAENSDDAAMTGLVSHKA